jgi:TonB family protein
MLVQRHTSIIWWLDAGSMQSTYRLYRILGYCLLIAIAPALGQSTQANKPDRTGCAIFPKGKLLKMVKPIYPPLAKSKAMAGAVTVELTIDKQGVPRTVRVSKGDPLLAQAVSTAIRQWRWAPYTLNGKAVEVEAVISVIFELW